MPPLWISHESLWSRRELAHLSLGRGALCRGGVRCNGMLTDSCLGLECSAKELCKHSHRWCNLGIHCRQPGRLQALHASGDGRQIPDYHERQHHAHAHLNRSRTLGRVAKMQIPLWLREPVSTGSLRSRPMKAARR